MHRRFPVASFALPSRSPAPTPNEAGWIHQLAAGESKAWARFVEEWSPRLYQYITANGLSETEAQTLLPLIFANAVQKVVGQTSDDSQPVMKPALLLFAVAYEQMMRYVHQPPNPQRREALSPAAEAMADPQALLLRRTLQQFSPEAQQVALLYYLCEMSLAEICQIVCQSELRVRTTLNQVKRQLCR